MARSLFFFFSLLALRIVSVSTSSTTSPLSSSKVINLHDENFTEFLTHSKLALVEFYAPWCGHCKKIENDYSQAAERLDELQIECHLARYDGSGNREFIKSLGLKGYPSFLLFRNGVQIAAYSGPRYADDIVEFMVNRATPIATPVETIYDVNLILDKGSKLRTKSSNPAIAILAMFQTDSPYDRSIPTLEQIANIRAAQNFLLSAELTDNRIIFMISASPSLFDYFGVTLEPNEGCLVSLMFPPADMDPFARKIPNDATIEMITETVASISAPTVIPFSTSYYRQMQSSFTPAIHVLAFCDDESDSGQQCLDLIHKIAPKYRGRMLFVTIPHSEYQLYKTFNFKISHVPKIVAVNMTSPDSFSRTVMDVPNASEDQDENEEDIIPRQLTEPVLLNFLENFLSGALAPTITSEELGPNEKTTLAYVPMHKVVASNFNTLVVESFQHFLLFVVAPWCGHCKSMEPTIRSLGKYIYKSSVNPPPTAAEYHESFPALNRGLFVGKMDGTKNDFPYPGIVIRGFPTVLLFKKSGAGATQSVDVIPYNGERSMNQILKFLDNQDSFRTPNQQQSRGGGDNYERDVDSDEGSRRSDEF